MADIFTYQHRVTYADCTMGNHVYYARYLTFLEAARGEFFRRVGQPFLRLQEEGVIFPVIECQITYKAPARYDDVLAIEVWLSRVEGVRIQFEYCARSQTNTEVLRASTMHVCTSVDEKPKRLPAPLVSVLQTYLRAAEVT